MVHFFRSMLSFQATSPTAADGLRVVFTPKLGKSSAGELVSAAEDDGVRHVLIVYATSCTPQGKAYVASCRIRVEVFGLLDLTFDLLSHEHIPRHRALSSEEKVAILAKYDCKDDELPRIKISDPVIRWLGLRKGVLVEITRQPDTLDEEITYRIVHS